MKELKNHIKLLFCLLFALNAYATEADNIITGSSYGEKTINEKGLNPNADKGNNLLFKDEVILNWLYYYENDPKAKARFNEVVAKKSDMIVKVVAEEKASTATDNNATELTVVKGYCFVSEDINVGKQPSSIRTDCQTNVGAIVMFADLVNVNERASLVVDPKYIEKNGVRFTVNSAIVTNEAKTSYNVATFVNDRKIAEIGWSALSVSSDEVKSRTNEYLKALEQSKTKQSTDYVTTGTGSNSSTYAVQNTNTEKPDPLDYLITGMVNITASVVKSTAEIFKKDLPYLYQIKGKSKIWIDLKVNKQGEYVK